MRTEKELRLQVEDIEKDYPPGKMVWGNPIGNYNLGVLAGLKIALGEYPTYSELGMEDFYKNTFPNSGEKPQ